MSGATCNSDCNPDIENIYNGKFTDVANRCSYAIHSLLVFFLVVKTYLMIKVTVKHTCNRVQVLMQ